MKLGDAIFLLLQTGRRVEQANYEIGLAVTNLKRWFREGLLSNNAPWLPVELNAFVVLIEFSS